MKLFEGNQKKQRITFKNQFVVPVEEKIIIFTRTDIEQYGDRIVGYDKTKTPMVREIYSKD